jgi:hypothetical protein
MVNPSCEGVETPLRSREFKGIRLYIQGNNTGGRNAMENHTVSGITVEETDSIIRRIFQEKFLTVQPPSKVWENIRCHLESYKPDVLTLRVHGKSSNTTQINTWYVSHD